MHWRIHDVFHVNVLSEARLDTIPRRRQPVPPPVKVNDEDFWVMEKYVNTQWFRNRFQFKIRWDGFSEEHDTWEDADSINSDDSPQVLGEDNDNFDLEEDFYSIADTLTLQGEPTLPLLEDSQPHDGEHTVSPWGHGPLVGGTVMISLFFLLFSSFSHSAPFCCFCYTPLHHRPMIHRFSSISLITVAHCASRLRCVDRRDLIAYMKHI